VGFEKVDRDVIVEVSRYNSERAMYVGNLKRKRTDERVVGFYRFAVDSV
jgi:hypothetical protein